MSTIPSNLPYAEACDRNREPILAVLLSIFSNVTEVLEIGSGTGQHAVYFAEAMPHLTWQTSDRVTNHPGINGWIKASGVTNVNTPLTLDVIEDEWPKRHFDGAFSANTAHIMPWNGVESTFRGLAQCLSPAAPFCLYGPFNDKGRYTSESNRQFDQWLKQQFPHQGIRDIEAMMALAESADFTLAEDIAMPANNRLLVWRKN